MEKGVKFLPCDHYDLDRQKNKANFVTINFKYFWEKI